MIVKVQISQFSSDKVVKMLVYDKSRTIMYEEDATKEILDVMKGEPKAFFNAELVDDPNKKGAKRVKITHKAAWQNW